MLLWWVRLLRYQNKVVKGEITSCGCKIDRYYREYYAWLDKNKLKLFQAGIVGVTYYQWKNNKIPYRCNTHRNPELKSRVSIKKFSVAPCFSCGREVASNKRIKSLEQFIKDADTFWNFRWDYSKTIYTGSHDDVVIICRDHGEYTQSATDHLSGYCACKGCSPQSGFDKNKSGNLYIVHWESNSHSFIKVGITNNQVSLRVNKQKTRRSGILFEPTVLDAYHFDSGYQCSDVESNIKTLIKELAVTREAFPDGYTETFESSRYLEIKHNIEDYLIKEKITYEKIKQESND